MKTAKLLVIFCFIFGISVNSYSQDEIDLLILNRKFKEALLKIDEFGQQSHTAKLLYKKGLILSNLQNYRDAVKVYSDALQLEPGNPEILSELAETYSTLGNYHDANRYFKKAISLQTGNLILKAKLGRNCILLKDYKCAYNCFSELYKSDSTNV